MLALYHNDMSLCAQKVRVGLAEKGLEWESRHLVLRAAEHQQPWYLKLNRRAVVPTLIDGEKVIPESNVILEYLDESFPDPALAPRDAYGRARMRLVDQAARRGCPRRLGRDPELRHRLPASISRTRRARQKDARADPQCLQARAPARRGREGSAVEALRHRGRAHGPAARRDGGGACAAPAGSPATITPWRTSRSRRTSPGSNISTSWA